MTLSAKQRELRLTADELVGLVLAALPLDFLTDQSVEKLDIAMRYWLASLTEPERERLFKQGLRS